MATRIELMTDVGNARVIFWEGAMGGVGRQVLRVKIPAEDAEVVWIAIGNGTPRKG